MSTVRTLYESSRSPRKQGRVSTWHELEMLQMLLEELW